jgi:hypothetical protein
MLDEAGRIQGRGHPTTIAGGCEERESTADQTDR